MRYRTSTYLYRVKFLFEISEAVKKNYGCRAKTYQLFEFLTKKCIIMHRLQLKLTSMLGISDVKLTTI